MATTNGGQPQEQPAGAAPQLNVLAQYTKDLSFENPNAPKALQQQPGQQPAISVQINVTPKQLTNTDFEVELKLEGKAELANTLVFGFELVYAGVFRLQNIPQENLGAVVMIECPRLLFPFARELVAGAVTSGGYPPLMLDPVDFVALYRQKMAQAAPGTPGAEAPKIA
jgi:preprotein translocase subunit SecB